MKNLYILYLLALFAVTFAAEEKAEVGAAEPEPTADKKPEEVESRQSSSGADITISSGPPGSNRQNSPGQIFGNLLQPLNPSNFLSNLLPGRNAQRRMIGEQCQYTSDCLAGTTNSVCFNGTCLCNLGYRYTAETSTCIQVDTCPSCPQDKCNSGTDIYCNGTCIRNMKAISIKGIGEEGKLGLSSPNWPEDYPAGTDVYYCITASAGRRVNVQFNWFDLETDCGYHCDYVSVYNGCQARPAELISFFHGDNVQARECVTSTCNELLIHFHTDPEGKLNGQRSGFMGILHEATYHNDLCSDCNG